LKTGYVTTIDNGLPDNLFMPVPEIICITLIIIMDLPILGQKQEEL
jgi:hypothetical protein